MIDDMAYVTTSVPLQNIDANEITDSIEGVVSIADSSRLTFLGLMNTEKCAYFRSCNALPRLLSA